MVTKARQLAEFIANADVDSDEIATGAVSASKLADTLDLSSKTIVMPDVAAFNITSGDVGIGTSSPVSELNVDGRIVVDDGARSNPSGGPSVVIDYQTTSDIQGRIRSRDWDGATWKNFAIEANNINLIPAGRVGVKNTGTDISGTSLDDVVIGAGTTVAGIVLDGGASSDTAYGFANAGTKVGRIQYINSSNSMVFQTNNANRMAIDGSGNVGVGTTSPGGLLDVQTTANRYFRIRSNNADLELLSDNNTNPVFRIQGTGTADLVNIYDNTQEVFTILDGGSVGIGHTDPSYAKLHIRNDVSGGSDNFLLMLQNATTVADSRSGIMFSTNSGQGAGRDGAAIQASNNGIDGKAHITFGNVINNTYEEKVRFTTDGKVGIGTTSPNRELEIKNDAPTGNTGIKIHNNSASNAAILELEAGRTSDGIDVSQILTANLGNNITNIRTQRRGADGGEIAFWTSAAGSGDVVTQRMVIDENGNVGIGTSNPGEKLHVEGSIRASGNIGVTQTDGDYLAKLYQSSADGFLELFTGEATPVSRTKLSSFGDSYINPNGGNIGIGTTSPGRKLDINGPDIVSVRIRSGNQSAYAGMEFTDEISSFSQVGYIRHTHSDTNTAAHTGQSGNAAFLVGTTENDTVIGFNSNMSSSSAGTNRGSIKFTSSGTTYNTTSDLRLKENIKPISDGKEKLLAMKPKTFNFIEDENKVKMHGFIAQEMKDIIPEAVSNTKDLELMMSMDYGRITPVIVAALQDALKEIEQLKTRINELEDK